MSTVDFENTHIAFEAKSNLELKRAQLLFQSLGFKTIVQIGPQFVKAALRWRLPVKPIIRATLFNQFCAGESVQDSKKTISRLARYGIGSILDYAAEGIESESSYDSSCEEIYRTISEASANENIPYSVFKPTALARFELMEKQSRKEALNPEEKKEWKRVRSRWLKLCKASSSKKVRLMIDAEESWIQPCIDELCLEMMRKYNQERAFIFTTAQMYLHDRLDYIKELYSTAEKQNFKVGIKLVRGAYMEKERKRASLMGYPSPIQKTKEDTDQDFDLACKFIIEKLDRFELCAGTHNEHSNKSLAELIKKSRLSNDNKKVYFAQLYGMSDNLTYNLAKAGYNTAKYLPYGEISIVLPYLFRRMEENSSIKGQASRELALIEKEIERRAKH